MVPMAAMATVRAVTPVVRRRLMLGVVYLGHAVILYP